MKPHEQWLETQAQRGRHLYLMLDGDGKTQQRNTLITELGSERCRNLYIGTAAVSMMDTAPYLFELQSTRCAALQELMAAPQDNWGWLASADSADIDALARHWQARLIAGERPNQALYRLHDNRVLGRALDFLQPEQRAAYLGLMTSVCYWQAGQWLVSDNPDPAPHPLPAEPAWLQTPVPRGISLGIQFDNARRYLIREHADELLALAQAEDIDSWLRSHLDLAHDWGWLEPEKIHFMLTRSLRLPSYFSSTTRLPKPEETPQLHYERLFLEARFWEGERPL